jgi:hypothetical protein
MRRLLACLLLVGCGSDQFLEHDLDPIRLERAPIEPGGAPLGGLLAATTTAAGVEPLLVDTAFPLNSLRRQGCVAGPAADGWTYTGDMEVRDAQGAGAHLRARFHSVGLFDICTGPTGDIGVQPGGVMGGPLLTSFAVGLVLPRAPDSSTSAALLSLWPAFPGSDDQLALDGWAVLHFEARGAASVGRGTGEPSLDLPNARIVLAACAAPRVFALTEPAEACARGEAGIKASGQELMLAVGTGEGPLILSEPAWQSVAAQLGVASDAGTAGLLHTAFTSTGVPALFVDIPRLALFQSTDDQDWLGACAELARARRIEWALARAEDGACFQRCDASGSRAMTTRPYLELGGSLRVAVVSQTSEIIRSLNADAPPNPQVDGVVGAGTLAGTRLRLDYAATPSGRVVAACEAESSREGCWAAPACPGFPEGSAHTCFGQAVSAWPPVCP